MRKIKLLTLLAALVCATNMWAAPAVAVNGKLPGTFTINSDGDQVCFSQGNLQYVGTWQFAENQWDCLGHTQSTNHRDLFGYGTGDNPNKTSSSQASYASFTDWGVNPITNGGNVANQWRTPTKDEWAYIFCTRPNAVNLFGLGSVNGVNGTILLPDNWELPAGSSFTASTTQGLVYQGEYYTNSNENNFSHNTYTTEQWAVMETAGAVFLPAAGFRYLSGSAAYNLNATGYYRSTDGYDETDAYVCAFDAVNLLPDGHGFRRIDGLSVRLIQDIPPASLTAAPTAIDGLVYDGSAQALVNAGTASGGTINYSLDNSSWSASIPTGTEGGNYTVYYKVVGDANHIDFTPSPNTVAITIADFSGSGTEGDPYIIPSTAVWNHLASKVVAGNAYSGKFFRQTADISVTTMVGAGSWENPTNPFSGTYDGDGNTLTFTISSSEHYIAPFRFVNGATFKNLIIDGANTSTGIYNAGLVGFSVGNVTITNCAVRATLTNNTYSSPFGGGNCSCGGFYGRLHTGSLAFTGCLFSGQIVGSGYCEGGFVGWASEPTGVVFTDCLFAPTALAYDTDGTNTFYRGADNVLTFTNCYYTEAFGTAQAKQAYSITAGTGVNVGNAGTPITTYNVSGITSYGTGIKYNGVLYAGASETVSLNLSGSAAGYEASAGTLSGSSNPYTLTMSGSNVIIISPVVNLSAYQDPQHPSDYYCTFYHGSKKYELFNAAEAYVATISGETLTLTKIAEEGQVIPANTAVIFKTNSSSITLIPSDASAVSAGTNSLQGTDAAITNPAYGNVYVLSGQGGEVGFFRLASGATIPAHKAYVVIPGGVAGAPKKLRFVFEGTQGVEQPTSGSSLKGGEKIFRDGILYIKHGEHLYNAQGQTVK